MPNDFVYFTLGKPTVFDLSKDQFNLYDVKTFPLSSGKFREIKCKVYLV